MLRARLGLLIALLASPAAAQITPLSSSPPVATTTTNGISHVDNSTITIDTTGQLVAHAGGAAGISQLTGDVTAGPGTGSQPATLATVNAGSGSVGSSTAIPVLTTNAKGLVTAQTTAAVVAPAGTLTGATLAAGVTTASLTTFTNLAGSGVKCLHTDNGGIVTPAANDCGTGSGAVSVTAAAPNVVITPSPGTGTFTVGTTIPENTQSGANYTIVSGDMVKVLERTYTSGASATTLPTVGTAGFGAGSGFIVHCAGPTSGGQADTLTLNTPIYTNGHMGVSSLSLPAGSCMLIADADGSNYIGIGPFGTIAEQMANAVVVTGGTINGTAIGGSTPAAGAFTTVSATGKITTAASATGGAGIVLPHGAAPTSPVNGDCWTTTAGLFCQINGSTVGPMGTSGSGCTFANPTATGSDTATNGVATTCMRSDASFAIQKTSSTLFGIAKVDNSTITAAAGVITAANTTINAQTCTPGSTCTIWTNEHYEAPSGQAAATTRYIAPGSNSNPAVLETPAVSSIAVVAGTYGNLYTAVGTAPGGTDTAIFTVRKCPGGTSCANTTSTCTITGAATTCNDTTHTFTVAAGDWIDVSIVTSATAANLTYTSMSIGFHQ